MITRGRGFEVLIGSVTLGVVLWSASTACHFANSSTGPACSATASPLNCIAISLSVQSDGPYTITFQGPYASQSGGTPQLNTTTFYYGLQPGEYTVSGTMSTANLTFFIVTQQSTAVGGVELGSVASTAGPFVATPSLCHMSYSATGSSPPPQQYSFTFAVGTTTPLC